MRIINRGREIRYFIFFILICLSAIGQEPQKISVDFDSFVTSTIPEYCEDISKEISLLRTDCDAIESFREDESLNDLVKFNIGLNKANLTDDLINVSIRKLLHSKAELLSLFPSLMPSDEEFIISDQFKVKLKHSRSRKYLNKPIVQLDQSATSNINACLKKNGNLDLEEYSKKISKDLE